MRKILFSFLSVYCIVSVYSVGLLTTLGVPLPADGDSGGGGEEKGQTRHNQERNDHQTEVGETGRGRRGRVIALPVAGGRGVALLVRLLVRGGRLLIAAGGGGVGARLLVGLAGG